MIQGVDKKMIIEWTESKIKLLFHHPPITPFPHYRVNTCRGVVLYLLRDGGIQLRIFVIIHFPSFHSQQSRGLDK